MYPQEVKHRVNSEKHKTLSLLYPFHIHWTSSLHISLPKGTPIHLSLSSSIKQNQLPTLIKLKRHHHHRHRLQPKSGNMAATTAVAVGSSLSTSIQTLKCIRSKNWPSDPLLRIASTRILQVGLLSHSTHAVESICPVSHNWRIPRISAAVAQEEAAATAEAEAEAEAEPVEVEEKEVDEVSDGGESEGTVNTKLYFGNLPYHFDSAQLAGIIQEYGSPELVEVLYDRYTGRSRGFAFVTMSSIEDCNAVIKNLDGSEYGGRTLRVNFSDKPRPKEPLYAETDYKLFVGNLAWSVTSESLTLVFQEYGNVVGARVLYDGETGRSRGYGFVCYSTKSEMETALESLNGVELEGRAIRVSLAQGKRQ